MLIILGVVGVFAATRGIIARSPVAPVGVVPAAASAPVVNVLPARLVLELDKPALASVNDWSVPDGGQGARRVQVFSLLPPRTHEIKVWTPGGQPHVERIDLRPGEEKRVRMDVGS